MRDKIVRTWHKDIQIHDTPKTAREGKRYMHTHVNKLT